MMRVTLHLREFVFDAVARQAEIEHRNPKQQAELNIERELQRAGYLLPEPSTLAPSATSQPDQAARE